MKPTHNPASAEMGTSAQLVLDTIHRRPTRGIPAWLLNPMEWRMIDCLADRPEGSYIREPVATYREMLLHSGCCMIDQWIPENPLTMGSAGFHSDIQRTATTGNDAIVLDGIVIDTPEKVIEHLEQVEWPRIRTAIQTFNQPQAAKQISDYEREIQQILGPDMLKTPYAHVGFPKFRYGAYGYINYFMAYALFPEMIEKDFSLQADLATLQNQAFVQACVQSNLPPLIRLDYDMAYSKGVFVDIRSLDLIWFPHFSRSIAPVRKAGIHMIWHCDGNLMQMVPRLLDVGLHGFQGFQYEDGMDYERICQMKSCEGDSLIIIAGVSVTRTLPHGTADDVRREMRWLVEKGPNTGLFLGASSSITPGVPWPNLQALASGLRHYRDHGRI